MKLANNSGFREICKSSVGAEIQLSCCKPFSKIKRQNISHYSVIHENMLTDDGRTLDASIHYKIAYEPSTQVS